MRLNHAILLPLGSYFINYLPPHKMFHRDGVIMAIPLKYWVLIIYSFYGCYWTIEDRVYY